MTKLLKQLLLCVTLLLAINATQVYAVTTQTTKPNAKIKTIEVSSVKELMATEKTTKSGFVTVIIADGTYVIPKGIYLTGEHITYKSKSGDREKVILKGNFKASHVFLIANDDVTIQDISIGEVNNHGIQVQSEKDADRMYVTNVRFFDIKEQMLKASGSKVESYSDDCIVENCLFEFTKKEAYQYYTGGIDVHKGKNWIVKNNVFKNITYPKGNLTEGAVHFWSNSTGTLIEKNKIINCDRGIMLGMDQSSHNLGILKDNEIECTRDVGIYLCNATNTSVIGNKIYVASKYPNAIEYRFKTDGTTIAQNITNRKIVSRNGAKAVLKDNTLNTKMAPISK